MAAPLKDGFGEATVSRLARNIQRAWDPFDVPGFIAHALTGLDDLELKLRVAHVADVLREALPGDYPEALAILVRSADTWDRGDEGDPLRGFAAWPVFHLIEHHGAHDLERSMPALRALTHLFSAEFAVRPFLGSDPDRAFAVLASWAEDPDEHVRRLVSEGCRPRLPWASRVPGLIEDPARVLALLELLKDDPELYVRRSVANNLNDIAKDHPDLVVDVCERWLVDASPERKWIVGHATRTLVKAGHPRVWGLLGFTEDVRVAASPLALEPAHVSIGESFRFSVELISTSTTSQRLAVDYAVHYVKANGKTRPKVFKLKVLTLGPRKAVSLGKKHSFRPISTRTHYPGPHAIELLVNGAVQARTEFELKPAGLPD